MPKSPPRFPPKAFEQIIQSLPSPPLIVGGQAVNLWATLFSRDHPEIKKFEPFTSRDCDVFGDQQLLAELAKIPGWRITRAKPGTASPVIGFLQNEAAPETGLMVEVLYSVYGLTPKELLQAIDLEIDGIHYRTLSPILLLKAKLANVVGLEQEDRDDIRHIQILIPCVAGYIEHSLDQFSNKNITERGVVKVLEAALEVCTSKHANTAKRGYGFDFAKCFPVSLAKSTSSKVKTFVEKRLSRLK